MRRGTWPLLAFLAGLLVGGVGVHLLRDEDPSVSAVSAVSGLPEVPEGPEVSGREAGGERSVRPGAVPGSRSRGAAQGAGAQADGSGATLDGGGVTEEERAFLRSALAAERLRRREAVIRPEDSGLDVLRRRFDHGADLSLLVADHDAFASHVRSPAGDAFEVASTGDVTRLTRDTIPDGTTLLRFGPGTFEVPALTVMTALRDRERTVPALEIRGAGMDDTVLIGLADWHVSGRVEHLVLRDFTWIGAEGGASIMLSVHAGVAARVENVRVKGWRTAGHGAAIGMSGPSYLALSDCEFLGGRRGGNEGGQAISLRDDCVVLATRCLFADLENGALSGWKGNGERAGVWLRDCTFENARLCAYGGNDPDWLHVHARGGTAAYGPASWTDEERRRWWFQGVAGEVEDVALGPGIARCTTADMARALARFTVPEDHRVLGVELTEFDRGGPLAFRLYLRGPGRWDEFRYVVRMDEPRVMPGAKDGTFPNVTDEDLRSLLPIQTLLERVAAPAGVTIRRFAYGSVYPRPDGSGFVPAIQVGLPWDHWIYDARDGSLLEHRSWRR